MKVLNDVVEGLVAHALIFIIRFPIEDVSTGMSDGWVGEKDTGRGILKRADISVELK
jgi:hypothetical protein